MYNTEQLKEKRKEARKEAQLKLLEYLEAEETALHYDIRVNKSVLIEYATNGTRSVSDIQRAARNLKELEYKQTQLSQNMEELEGRIGLENIPERA